MERSPKRLRQRQKWGDRQNLSLPCARTYVCDADGGVRKREGNGRVDKVVDLGLPEMVLKIESGQWSGVGLLWT